MVIDYRSSFIENQNLLALNLDDQQFDHQTFAFKRQSEFVGLFNHEINLMEESGVLQRIRAKWTGAFDDLFNESSEETALQAIELGFENVIFPFLIVATGVCVGVALLVFEILSRRERTQKRLFMKKAYLTNSVQGINP